jgi:hypothetical protein
MCWRLVSAVFGQSTQQIHSLRARGVRSSHAARTFGLAIKTRLKSIGTVWTTPPEITLELILAHRSSGAGEGSLAGGQSIRWARATMIPSGPRT